MKHVVKHPEGGVTRVDLRAGVLSITVLSEIGGVVSEWEAPLSALSALSGVPAQTGPERMVRIPTPSGEVI